MVEKYMVEKFMVKKVGVEISVIALENSYSSSWLKNPGLNRLGLNFQ